MKRVSAWVFWLALLLPLAQLGAAVHGYAHLQDPAKTSSDKHLLASCDVCVAAAVIGAGAAPASTPAAVLPAPLQHPAPLQPAAIAPPFQAAVPYQSRAPPALPA
jgi:hypothetical protein